MEGSKAGCRSAKPSYSSSKDVEYEYEYENRTDGCSVITHAHLRSRLSTLDRPPLQPSLAVAGDYAPWRAGATEKPGDPLFAARGLGACPGAGHIPGPVGIDRAEERQRDALARPTAPGKAGDRGGPGRVS